VPGSGLVDDGKNIAGAAIASKRLWGRYAT